MISTPATPRQVLCVSVPRAGHHYFASLIGRVLGDDCWYCEFYTPVDCCRRIPCTRGTSQRLVLQKNHDFALDLPTDLPGVLYVVQYRHPVAAVLSDREYLARLEGEVRADDFDEFRVWLGGKAAHFRLFWDKWIARQSGTRIVVEYSELLRNPVGTIQRVLHAVKIDVEPGNIETAVRQVSGFVADFPQPAAPVPFQARSIETSRYFDRDLMAVYESMLLDTIPGLEPSGGLPRVESSGSVTRLVYDAALCTHRQSHREAAAFLRKAADTAPLNPFVWYELSLALLRSNDRGAAIEAADKAVRLRPENALVVRHLSDLYSQQGRSDLDRAIALGRTLIELCPNDPGHLVHLSALLVRSRDYGTAAHLASRAVLNNPSDPGVWRECSEVLSITGDSAGAIRAIKEALIRRPDSGEFHHHLGNLLQQSGDVDNAIDAHKRALELAPEEVSWRSALARDLAAAGRSREEHRPMDKPTREDVILAYRFLLGREPEDEQVINAHLTAPNRTELIRRFVTSDEFGARFGTGTRLTQAQAPVQGLQPRLKSLLSAFAPRELPAPNAGSWVDALGVQTRCAYRKEWADRVGRVVPDPEVELIEWLAVLESVAEAQQNYCIMELGAGHGPWLVRGATAWHRRWPERPMLLVGVEGEPEHFRYLQQHVADNRLPAEALRLLRAAVGGRDGEAEFETSPSPDSDWGTRLADGPRIMGLPRSAGITTTLTRVVSLETLAVDLEHIDFLHVDIQGFEVPVLQAGAEVLRTRTGRVLVGTHSRSIESQLIELMSGLDFRLEFEQPCRYRLNATPPVLVEDGVQYWIKIPR